MKILTKTTNSEPAGACSGRDPAQLEALVGGVAGPVGPRCGLARFVFPGYNREEGQNCKTGGGKLYFSVFTNCRATYTA